MYKRLVFIIWTKGMSGRGFACIPCVWSSYLLFTTAWLNNG